MVAKLKYLGPDNHARPKHLGSGMVVRLKVLALGLVTMPDPRRVQGA